MIEFRNVTKFYGKLKAVDNLNLIIENSELLAYLGRNGAGKTTTLKMLAGMIKPSSGQILIDDIDIIKEPVKAKAKFAFIPDNPYIYEKLTGIEFLRFVGRLYGLSSTAIDEKANKLLEMFDIKGVANLKTESYSHGMKQKLVFSSALIHDPEIIIVDEPMVGLDPQAARLVKDIFRDLVVQKGLTIFLSTHSLNIAEEIADRIAIIHEGKLLTIGTKAELEAKHVQNAVNIEELFLGITGQLDKDLTWLTQ